MQVFIHTGHLSVDNGAVFPMSIYVDLAKVLGIPTEYGQYYGDDRLTIDPADWPIAQELLNESKLLYYVPEHGERLWRNVQTDEVRRRMAHLQH